MEPPPDLEDVYRPFEDPGLKNVEEQTEFREHELGELGDLLGLGRSTQDSSEVATSGSGGVVDLSFQEKAEQAKAAPQVAQAAVKAKVASRAQSAPVAEGGEAMKRIPANAKGFGSDDLFGNAEPQDDSLFQTMCKMLPEQVTQRVDCLAVSTAKGLEVEVPVLDPVTAEHAATAANRSVEGRWVPTYMRQQLAAGGHTSLPSAPNGHEFSASAQPPSCGQAFIDMGHDFGEGAQAVLEFMAAFFTSLTFQCQACSHHAISTAHEQVMVLGDDWCGFAETEDDVMEHIRTVPNGPAAEAGQAYRDTSGVPNARSEGREGGPGGPGPGGPGPADSGEALRAPALAQPAFGAFSSFDKLEPKIEVGRVDKDLLMQVASTI